MSTEQDILSEIERLAIEFEHAEPRDYGRIRREFVDFCNLYFARSFGSSTIGDRQTDYSLVLENREILMAILYHPYMLVRLTELARRVRKPIVTYVFSLEEIQSGDVDDPSGRIEVSAVPPVLLDVYRRLFS